VPAWSAVRQEAVQHHQVSSPGLAWLEVLERQLRRTPRPVSQLGVTLTAGQLETLLDAHLPLLANSVQQLGLRLDLHQLTTGRAGRLTLQELGESNEETTPEPQLVRDAAGLRTFYRQLLRLQTHGFYPFAYDLLDSMDIREFKVPGLPDPVPDSFEVAFLKTTCV